jgi:hypothetical protein
MDQLRQNPEHEKNDDFEAAAAKIAQLQAELDASVYDQEDILDAKDAEIKKLRAQLKENLLHHTAVPVKIEGATSADRGNELRKRRADGAESKEVAFQEMSRKVVRLQEELSKLQECHAPENVSGTKDKVIGELRKEVAKYREHLTSAINYKTEKIAKLFKDNKEKSAEIKSLHTEVERLRKELGGTKTLKVSKANKKRTSSKVSSNTYSESLKGPQNDQYNEINNDNDDDSDATDIYVPAEGFVEPEDAPAGLRRSKRIRF